MTSQRTGRRKPIPQILIDQACVRAFPDNAHSVINGLALPDFDTRLGYVIDDPTLIHQAAYDLVSAWLMWAEEDGDYDTGEQRELEAELQSAFDVVNGTTVQARAAQVAA